MAQINDTRFIGPNAVTADDIKLQNNQYLLARNQLDNGDINLLKVDTSNRAVLSLWTFPSADGTNGQVLSTNGSGVLSWITAGSGANTALSNLGTTAINADLLFDSHATRSIGSTGTRANFIFGTFGFFGSGAANGLRLAGSETMPSGAITNATVRAEAGQALGLYTIDQAATKNVNIETGNASSGASGNINLQTGTATTTRGTITLNAPTIYATGNLIPSTDGTYTLGTNAGAINFLSVYSRQFLSEWTSGTVTRFGSGFNRGNPVNFESGTANSPGVNTGDVTIQAGNVLNGNTTGTAGRLFLYAAGVQHATNTNAGGTINMETRDISGLGASGAITIKSGNISNVSNTAGTGSINLTTGTTTGSGVRGDINLTSRIVYLITTSGVGVTGNMNPSITNTYNLGASSAAWNIVYGRLFLSSAGDFAAGSNFNTGFNSLFQSGHSNTAAITGSATFQSGDQLTSGTGTVGAAIFRSGNTASGNSNPTGTVTLKSGDASGSGASGSVTISSGSSASAASGNITIQTGTAGTTRGAITLDGLEVTTASLLRPAATDAVQLGSTTMRWSFVNANAYTAIHTTGAQAGQISSSTATPSGLGSGAGGGVSLIGLSGGKWAGVFTINRPSGGTEPTYLETGNAGAGNSGLINIQTGTATANSGNINIQTGTATGTRGKIIFKDGSEGTVGHVWTSTGVNGEGAWQAASGGGANTALSNLAATAVNVDIIPGLDSSYGLGSAANKWTYLFANQAQDSSNNTVIDFAGRALYNNTNNIALDWSTPGTISSFSVIQPSTDQFYTLGASGLKWNGVYTTSIETDANTLFLNCSQVDVNSVKIINLASPTNGTDAANASYVDQAESDANTYTDTAITNLNLSTTYANVSLSNLSAVNIGTHLLVGTNTTYDMGDGTNAWNYLYVNGIRYGASGVFIDVQSRVLNDSGTNVVADIENRIFRIQSDITANRPAAVAGQMFFDTTLGIPIWFDGTNWVDATGTTV